MESLHSPHSTQSKLRFYLFLVSCSTREEEAIEQKQASIEAVRFLEPGMSRTNSTSLWSSAPFLSFTFYPSPGRLIMKADTTLHGMLLIQIIFAYLSSDSSSHCIVPRAYFIFPVWENLFLKISDKVLGRCKSNW